ncbi:MULTISPECIES: protealysin inhibitor emfourin [unclassified Arthrobacter]|uniref:protealysin inhibitor emfourin n=1 Tax=unclassified Arthrobacter TaxID=235627 RepID=UPI001E591D23|nr:MULTISPECIES: protealysin inhibitor emfourin [unclassified Arthrobacter]MCC9144654.1 hypothetical protein [Arthrobacter sp. zg-Y919]MDK1275880.1 hypothetical protein [Arthrobacter sp. zg.Y919]WIB02761.1 hypothetical protein QNO10_12565 [Arthrobacter sp. zg-Y919]
MKLVVVRSGGFAGMQRTWSTQVSSEEAQERWLPLLNDPPEVPDSEPDRFTYEISVGPAAVTIPERQVKGRWRELVDRARTGGEASGGEAADGKDAGEASGN